MTNYLQIDVNAFIRNIQRVKKIVGNHVKIMAVLKADAYGHGLSVLAERAQDCVSAIAVGAPEEGISLRENGITLPVLALNGITKGYEKELIVNDVSSVVSTYEALDLFEKAASLLDRQARIHLKVDTGMGRLGFASEQFPVVFEKAINMKGISVEGVMTHFAAAFDKKSSYTDRQIRIFTSLCEGISAKGHTIPFIHAANSGAILHYPGSCFNMVRPGIILYGSFPSDSVDYKERFEPVMQFKSAIVHIGKIKKGESAGYNREFIADKDIKTGIIPTGYATGYNRALSGKSEVIVKGKRARQIGLICMDLSIIDITEVDDVRIGDEVVLIGKQGSQEITVEEIAQKLHTIPYETLCMIGNSVQRVYC